MVSLELIRHFLRGLHFFEGAFLAGEVFIEFSIFSSARGIYELFYFVLEGGFDVSIGTYFGRGNCPDCFPLR